ncbi:50S ribosomal protein L24 [Candidatus Mycoplasma pogonae]
MKFKVNDEVIVIAGSHKGKTGKVLQVFPKVNRLTIKDINVVTKHVKPSQQKTEGGIETFEAPIDASNVAYLLKKASKDKPAEYTRIGYLVKDGLRVRVAKKTGKVID